VAHHVPHCQMMLQLLNRYSVGHKGTTELESTGVNNVPDHRVRKNAVSEYFLGAGGEVGPFDWERCGQ
jgi:hypothetical protein